MENLKTKYTFQYGILFPVVFILGYIFSFIQYQSIRNSLIDPYNSIIDYRVLMGISIVNIFFLILFYKKTINVLFLTIQLILLLFIITLSNNNLAITVILSSVFLFSSGYYLKKPGNLFFTVFASFSILCFQQSINIDNIQTPTINAREFIMLLFLFILILILNYIISSIIESYESLTEVIEKQKNTIINLIETNVGIQKYALNKKEEFENAERLRITRDIHDTIGYVLTNNIMLIRACSYYVPRRLKKAQTFLSDALTNAQNGLNETRSILRKLHSFNRIKGIEEIVKIIKLFKESTGIEVNYNFGNTKGTWGSQLDYVFFRIIQEGLVNSVKHGRATRISVSFWQTDKEILLSISDNGRELQDGEIKKGIGLQGMEERLSRFNGKLDAQSYPLGFTLNISVPLESIEKEEINEINQADVC